MPTIKQQIRTRVKSRYYEKHTNKFNKQNFTRDNWKDKKIKLLNIFDFYSNSNGLDN